MANGDVHWDEAELEEMLNGMDGPVGQFLAEKARQMAEYATAAAPVQKPQNFSWGKNSSSYLPRSIGYLKAGIKPHMGYTQGGTIYGGVNAPYGPTLFLEQPARQMRKTYPFMSVALYAVTVE